MTELTGLQKRLLVEPDYRPHCLNCSTMRRVVLSEKDGRRIMTCEIVAEDGHAAIALARFGILPRVDCGISWDIDTQEILSHGVRRASYPR